MRLPSIVVFSFVSAGDARRAQSTLNPATSFRAGVVSASPQLTRTRLSPRAALSAHHGSDVRSRRKLARNLPIAMVDVFNSFLQSQKRSFTTEGVLTSKTRAMPRASEDGSDDNVIVIDVTAQPGANAVEDDSDIHGFDRVVRPKSTSMSANGVVGDTFTDFLSSQRRSFPTGFGDTNLAGKAGSTKSVASATHNVYGKVVRTKREPMSANEVDEDTFTDFLSSQRRSFPTGFGDTNLAGKAGSTKSVSSTSPMLSASEGSGETSGKVVSRKLVSSIADGSGDHFDNFLLSQRRSFPTDFGDTNLAGKAGNTKSVQPMPSASEDNDDIDGTVVTRKLVSSLAEGRGDYFDTFLLSQRRSFPTKFGGTNIVVQTPNTKPMLATQRDSDIVNQVLRRDYFDNFLLSQTRSFPTNFGDTNLAGKAGNTKSVSSLGLVLSTSEGAGDVVGKVVSRQPVSSIAELDNFLQSKSRSFSRVGSTATSSVTKGGGDIFNSFLSSQGRSPCSEVGRVIPASVQQVASTAAESRMSSENEDSTADEDVSEDALEEDRAMDQHSEDSLEEDLSMD